MNAVIDDRDEAPEQSLNPFAAAVRPAAAASNAVSEAATQREFAEIQAAMVIAQKFPRDEKRAVDRILTACARPSLAENALYSYSRGGSEVTGPSIRMAEAIAQNWGNLQFGIRELDQRNGESTVEAFAWDLETNTRQNKVFQVPHIRYTRNGSKKLTDPRDVYEMVANQGARRLRACILGVIPGDVIDAAVRQCEVTLKSRVEITPERLKGMLELFEGYGVGKEAIEKKIGRHLDTITPAQFLQLGKIANSLRDGMSSPADWFQLEPSGKPETAAPQAKAPAKPNGSTEAEAEPERLITKGQATALKKAIDQAGVPVKDFCKKYEVETPDELPFAKLADAIAWLDGIG